MDKFNVRILELEGAKRWLREIVDGDSNMDAYGREVFRAAIAKPDMFIDNFMWTVVGRLPLATPFNSLMHWVPPEVRAGYALHELAARRFARGEDRYIETDVELMGKGDKLSGPISSASAMPAGLIDKALKELGARDAREYIRYEMKQTDKGEKADYEREKIRLFKTGDDDFMSKLFERMKEDASWTGLWGKEDPSYGKARHAALLSDEHGFMVMARGGGHYNAVRYALEGAIREAFDSYPIPMTKIEVAYDKADETRMRATFSRRDPAIGPFESFARHVLVKSDEVELTMEPTLRPVDEPLMFEYEPGAEGSGWPRPKAGSLWRVESSIKPDLAIGDAIGGMQIIKGMMFKDTRLYLRGSGRLVEVGSGEDVEHADSFMGGMLEVLAVGDQAGPAVISAWEFLEGGARRSVRSGGGGRACSITCAPPMRFGAGLMFSSALRPVRPLI